MQMVGYNNVLDIKPEPLEQKRSIVYNIVLTSNIGDCEIWSQTVRS